MAATPFTGLIEAREIATGKPVSLRFTATDVAQAFVLFPDLNSTAELIPPVDSGGYEIQDFTLNQAGVDTTALQLRKGTADLTIIGRDSKLANLTTDVVSRCGAYFKLKLVPGAKYFIRQIA